MFNYQGMMPLPSILPSSMAGILGMILPGLSSNCSHGFQVHLAMALPQPLGASPGAALRRGLELRLEQVSRNYCIR